MTSNDLAIFAINGIWTDSESVNGWTDKVERWCDRLDIDSHRYEPETRWVTRRMPWHLPKYVEAAKTLFANCARPHKILIAHSFGCEIVLKALLAGNVRFETVVLVQGATHADCVKNGMNQLIFDHTVGRFLCTVSANDKPLRWSRYVPPNIWHPLGLFGPDNTDYHGAIKSHRWDDLDHSTMWDHNHFDATMDWIASVAIPLPRKTRTLNREPK